MGPFDAVVQALVGSMADVQSKLAQSRAIAPKLVGDDHPRLAPTGDQSGDKTLRSTSIAPRLNKNIKHFAIAIHCAP